MLLSALKGHNAEALARDRSDHQRSDPHAALSGSAIYDKSSRQYLSESGKPYKTKLQDEILVS